MSSVVGGTVPLSERAGSTSAETVLGLALEELPSSPLVAVPVVLEEDEVLAEAMLGKVLPEADEGAASLPETAGVDDPQLEEPRPA